MDQPLEKDLWESREPSKNQNCKRSSIRSMLRNSIGRDTLLLRIQSPLEMTKRRRRDKTLASSTLRERWLKNDCCLFIIPAFSSESWAYLPWRCTSFCLIFEETLTFCDNAASLWLGADYFWWITAFAGRLSVHRSWVCGWMSICPCCRIHQDRSFGFLFVVGDVFCTWEYFNCFRIRADTIHLPYCSLIALRC